MALIARVYRSDPDERRRAERYPVEVGGTLRGSDGEPLDVLVYDLSMTGFRMETTATLDLDAPIWIGIAGAQVNAAVVARRGPNGYGCEFVTPITFYQLSEALDPQPTVHQIARPEEADTVGEEDVPVWVLSAVVGVTAVLVLGVMLLGFS